MRLQHRFWAALAFTLAASSSLSCYDDSGPPPGPREQPFSCEQLTSCQTCTPVLGCGWCQSGDKGICVSDPHRCARAETFTWTWELAFCPATGGDGGVSETDARSWPDATSPSDGSAADHVQSQADAGDAAHE